MKERARSMPKPNFRLAFLFDKRQTGLTMKTRPQLLFLAGAAALALGACATLSWKDTGGHSLHAGVHRDPSRDKYLAAGRSSSSTGYCASTKAASTKSKRLKTVRSKHRAG